MDKIEMDRKMMNTKFLTWLFIIQMICITALSYVLSEPTVDECIDIIWESQDE